MTAWARQRGHTESYKTSQDASHIGDIKGNANRSYSASQKRCRKRNYYLRPTVQPSFAPFLCCCFFLFFFVVVFFVYFVWCKCSTRRTHTYGSAASEVQCI